MKVAGVTAAWDRPTGQTSAVLVLAHGAGGDFKDQLLVRVGAKLADRGIAVLRFNFPYRESGRRAPGAQRQSEDCYRAIIERVAGEGAPLFCGGKSYGGRIASHIVADGTAVDGLVLISYPLHAPGRQDKLRDAHLGRIAVPMLFLQGTRDSFADLDLLRSTLAKLNGARLYSLDGGDHSLKVRGTPQDEVADRVSAEIGSFITSRA